MVNFSTELSVLKSARNLVKQFVRTRYSVTRIKTAKTEITLPHKSKTSLALEGQ